jgi:hypothetical protein
MRKIIHGQAVRYLGAGSLVMAPAWSWAGLESPGTITFEPLNASSIPTLGGTMMILLAALLAFIAFRSVRASGGRGSAGVLLVGALAAGSLASGVGGFNLLRDAIASGATGIITPTGPFTFDIQPFQFNQYTNESGGTLRIVEIVPPKGEGTCPALEAPVSISELNAAAMPVGVECEVDNQLANTMLCFIDCTSNTPSDARLKTNITPIGHAANGLPLYEFSYIGDTRRYRGVMAQDVILHTPEAVVTLPNGYLGVNYGMLGLKMTRIQ